MGRRREEIPLRSSSSHMIFRTPSPFYPSGLICPVTVNKKGINQGFNHKSNVKPTSVVDYILRY